MIKDVDKSDVIGPQVIDSPVLGGISPRELSGGVKTLIDIYKRPGLNNQTLKYAVRNVLTA